MLLERRSNRIWREVWATGNQLLRLLHDSEHRSIVGPPSRCTSRKANREGDPAHVAARGKAPNREHLGSETTYYFVISAVVEPLPFRAPSQLNPMVSLDPAQIFAAVVVFSVPQTASGVLGIPIDRLHSRSNAFDEHGARRLHPIRLIKTLPNR